MTVFGDKVWNEVAKLKGGVKLGPNPHDWGPSKKDEVRAQTHTEGRLGEDRGTRQPSTREGKGS